MSDANSGVEIITKYYTYKIYTIFDGQRIEEVPGQPSITWVELENYFKGLLLFVEEDFNQFVKSVQAVADEKVWIHCAANARVSAFLYRYRCSVLGEDEPTAESDLRKIWRPLYSCRFCRCSRFDTGEGIRKCERGVLSHIASRMRSRRGEGGSAPVIEMVFPACEGTSDSS